VLPIPVDGQEKPAESLKMYIKRTKTGMFKYYKYERHSLPRLSYHSVFGAFVLSYHSVFCLATLTLTTPPTTTAGTRCSSRTATSSS
jgi:hypothetical protein